MLTARPGQSTCPYCKDDVVKGPACPRCGARYHDECALTYGRCAALACNGTLDGAGPVRGLAVALPRLRVVAHRLGQGRWPVDGLPDDGPPFLVALFPAPREVEARDGAVKAVAEVLGQTALDARLRLGANVPEPLCRAADREGADRVVARLEREALPALALPLARALRPLRSVDVDGARVAPGGVVLREAPLDGAVGHERLIPHGPDGKADALVVTAPLVEVRRWQETSRPGASETSRFKAAPSKTTTRDRKVRDAAALVFLRDDPVPVLLRASTLKDVTGLKKGPVATQNLEQLVAALGATRVDLAGAADDTMLTLQIAAMTARGETVSDNRRPVELAARLHYHRWMAGR